MCVCVHVNTVCAMRNGIDGGGYHATLNSMDLDLVGGGAKFAWMTSSL